MESLLNFQSNYSKKITIRSTMELSNMNGDFLLQLFSEIL